MEVKKKPEEIFREYERGVQYNQRIGEDGLYEAVERYENFYIGRHWEGVNAPEMEKPVLNFTHRVISYLISMLVADDIGVSGGMGRQQSHRGPGGDCNGKSGILADDKGGGDHL